MVKPGQFHNGPNKPDGTGDREEREKGRKR